MKRLLGAIGSLARRVTASTTVATARLSSPIETREGRLRAVFGHSAIGIALLDRASRIVHANAALERFLGLELSELSGRRITDFSSAEDAGATSSMLDEVASGARDNVAAEARFVRRDGSIGWGALSV